MTTATIPAQTIATPTTMSTTRLGAAILGTGVVLMVAGAIVLTTTDTDLWQALSGGTISSYLADASGQRTTMFAQLALWIAGAVCLGAGGAILTTRANGGGAQLSRTVYELGAGLAVVAFTTWMGLIRVSDTLDPVTGELVGFIATRLDDLATVALLGIAPAALAASSPWIGRRLRRSAIAVGAATLIAILASITDTSPTVGFALVPIGLGWTLAAAIAAYRSDR